MLFFKVIFEFNFRTTLGKYLLKAVNNLCNLGFIKFRTDPNNKTGYLIHGACFSFRTYSTIQIYLPE